MLNHGDTMSGGFYRSVISGIAAAGLLVGTIVLSGKADSRQVYMPSNADTLVVDSVHHSPEYNAVFPDYYTTMFSDGHEYTIRGKFSVEPGDNVVIGSNGRPRIIR